MLKSVKDLLKGMVHHISTLGESPFGFRPQICPFRNQKVWHPAGKPRSTSSHLEDFVVFWGFRTIGRNKEQTSNWKNKDFPYITKWHLGFSHQLIRQSEPVRARTKCFWVSTYMQHFFASTWYSNIVRFSTIFNLVSCQQTKNYGQGISPIRVCLIDQSS